MVKGLYTAYTGMINEQHRMDVLTNNLANANTNGYKKEGATAQSFKDQLALKIKDITDAPFTARGLGIINPGVKIGEGYVDWTEGPMKETHNTFDMAIGGSGYIEIAPVEGQLQATTDQSDWCHLTVSGDRIDVKVDPYEGLESRYAVVNMTAGKATGKTIVHQFGVIVKEYAWKDITVKNESQTIEFPYDANGNVVKAESDQDWVTFEATDEKMIIHVAQNPTTDYREALVHWSIGQVTGEITVGQFDLEAAGLLGKWTWHGKQQPNNRDFPMEATLTETGDGVYSLAFAYSTTSVEIDMKVEGVTLGQRIDKAWHQLGHREMATWTRHMRKEYCNMWLDRYYEALP